MEPLTLNDIIINGDATTAIDADGNGRNLLFDSGIPMYDLYIKRVDGQIISLGDGNGDISTKSITGGLMCPHFNIDDHHADLYMVVDIFRNTTWMSILGFLSRMNNSDGWKYMYIHDCGPQFYNMNVLDSLEQHRNIDLEHYPLSTLIDNKSPFISVDDDTFGSIRRQFKSQQYTYDRFDDGWSLLLTKEWLNNRMSQVPWDGFCRVDVPLPSFYKEWPTVCISILVRNGENFLHTYLDCIESQQYPKNRIGIYIHTNSNTDNTENILTAWTQQWQDRYHSIKLITDKPDVVKDVDVARYSNHEWNSVRFFVLGNIRNMAIDYARQEKYDFYFTVDVDNFIVPETLPSLVKLNLPIVAPMLPLDFADTTYANFHAAVTDNGYFKDTDLFNNIRFQHVTGIIEVPVVHCSYLIRSDCIPKINYVDHSGRHEYVIFSESARNTDIKQYIDNTTFWGFLNLGNKMFEQKGAKYLLRFMHYLTNRHLHTSNINL